MSACILFSKIILYKIIKGSVTYGRLQLMRGTPFCQHIMDFVVDKKCLSKFGNNSDGYSSVGVLSTH